MGAMYWLIGGGVISMLGLGMVMWMAHRRISSRASIRRRISNKGEAQATMVVEKVARQQEKSDEWYAKHQVALVAVQHHLAQGNIGQLGTNRKA